MLGGALVAVLAGLVGLEISFHAGSATGASVALALCRCRPGSDRAYASAGRGLPAHDHDGHAERQQREADQLGLGEPGHDRVVAANDLDEEAPRR